MAQQRDPIRPLLPRRRRRLPRIAVAVPAALALLAVAVPSPPDPSAASAAPASLAAAPARLALAPVVSAAPAGSAVRLGAGIFTMRDFSSRLVGADLGGDHRGLIGAGSRRTRVLMEPGTSTKAGLVPTTPWTTNQLYLLSSLGGSPTLRGFTLQGTDQGHLYNGLRIGQATGARISDVRVRAVPGDAPMPPGETFGINDWRTSGSRYTRIEVDGRRIGASGFATNSSTDVEVDGGYFHDEQGGGAVFWQTRDITLTDVRVARNRTGLNFERVSGTVRIVRPVFDGNRGQDLYFGTDRESARVVIVDPVYSGKQLRIQVPKTYRDTTAKQRRSDVRVIIRGVDRTAEVVHWVGR